MINLILINTWGGGLSRSQGYKHLQLLMLTELPPSPSLQISSKAPSGLSYSAAAHAEYHSEWILLPMKAQMILSLAQISSIIKDACKTTHFSLQPPTLITNTHDGGFDFMGKDCQNGNEGFRKQRQWENKALFPKSRILIFRSERYQQRISKLNPLFQVRSHKKDCC